MTFLDAAITVLRDAGPLTTSQIAHEAIARRLINTSGRTPEASLSATLYAAVNSRWVPGLERLFGPGRTRARRGSVRWRYRPK